ncbi:O-succinylbenzoic acid--CoA ligase [Haladaptatus paucihalophilus DX253]|uniref:2-succinylbenzoate--CoA ligase n=1 Tax=Haladaptatus paucihalophilus DX253 TaxID=797209 RepID=E7QWV9_HALPU|nr:o-succinylbenzoate--CoA ligase [Haladaptatus paucihalophilus]EFW90762.1 O-succinylbenzoic acid--CoA ligase [Haladaptatus paucihalophilus DX253]SHK21701.1 O-succinylbenzoic acid--CoA ligase [Haladaptatus paucihalophilus DX253]
MNDWLTHRADVSPEATAIVEASDGTEWTYERLDTVVEEIAGKLAALGIREGDHLGMLMETRMDGVVLVHAAMRLGCVLVPLNVRLATPELRRQVAVTNLSALVCEAETESVARDAAGDVPVVSVDPSDTTLADRDPAAFTPADWSREDPQVLLFTSGTTGNPKAVTLTMGNLYASATASAFRLGVLPADRWHLCLSTYHMGGLAPLLRSTLYGTTVVLQKRFDAEETLSHLREYEPTGISLVPTMLRRLLDSGDLPDSLRFVLLGGAPARDDLIEGCADRGVPVCPTYGMTETASQIATATPDEAASHVGTVGRPLVFTDVSVVADDGSLAPPGEPGELVVSGPTVMAGYYGNPEATEEAFCEHGLRTGDVGYRDEGGRLWVLNRRSDRIVTGGENVHPGEVVDVLRDHPDVAEVAVVGVEDDEWGERIAALVVPDDDAPVTLDSVREFCDDRLAGYKHPRLLDTAAELPRTTSGTVDREAVRERFR